MHYLKLLCLCSVLYVSATSANTFYATGNQFQEAINRGDPTNLGWVIGYVLGVVDSLDSVKNPLTGLCFAIPEGVSVEQLTEIAMKYVMNNPQIRHLPANALVAIALSKNFPCKP